MLVLIAETRSLMQQVPDLLRSLGGAVRLLHEWGSEHHDTLQLNVDKDAAAWENVKQMADDLYETVGPQLNVAIADVQVKVRELVKREAVLVREIDESVPYDLGGALEDFDSGVSSAYQRLNRALARLDEFADAAADTIKRQQLYDLEAERGSALALVNSKAQQLVGLKGLWDVFVMLDSELRRFSEQRLVDVNLDELVRSLDALKRELYGVKHASQHWPIFQVQN